MEHISKEKAYDILEKYMKGEMYIEHSKAVEAIMRKLAEKLDCIRSYEWVYKSDSADISR